MAKVTRASRRLTMSLEREPTLDELAEKTGLSCRYLKKLDIINKKSYSLESCPPNGREQPLVESIEGKTFPAADELVDMARRDRQIRGWLDKLGR